MGGRAARSLRETCAHWLPGGAFDFCRAWFSNMLDDSSSLRSSVILWSIGRKTSVTCGGDRVGT